MDSKKWQLTAITLLEHNLRWPGDDASQSHLIAAAWTAAAHRLEHTESKM